MTSVLASGKGCVCVCVSVSLYAWVYVQPVTCVIQSTVGDWLATNSKTLSHQVHFPTLVLSVDMQGGGEVCVCMYVCVLIYVWLNEELK